MSVSIYDGTNDELNKIAGREDTSFWEGTQAQWDALSSSEKAEWTGKYVIITDDEENLFEVGTTTANTDLNDLPAGVAYCATSCTNLPVSATGFAITIERKNSNKVQLYTSSPSYVGHIYKRVYNYNTSTWSAWQDLSGTALS